MTEYKVLIDDENIPKALARTLLNRGYFAVPCGSGQDGKGWITASGSSFSVTKPDVIGNPPSIDDVMSVFDRHPGCGISVAVPYLRDSNDVLLAIDVDVRDTDTLDKIALIINQPCPVKRGERGATFFVRSNRVIAMDVLLKDRGIPIPKIPDVSGKNKNSVQSGKIGSARWSHEYIDILGTANRHSVLPPSLHVLGSESHGHELRYKWIKFPGSELTLKLEETNPSDLPFIQHYSYLLIFQWAKNPDSPIWKFLGETSKGNFHQLMLEASLYLWHEKFNKEEIEEICLREAVRSAESDSHLAERKTAIKNSIKDLEIKFPEQKPAKTARSNGGMKIPTDRQAYDWLWDQYEKENLGAFNGIPYEWKDGQWKPMLDLLNRNPAQELRNKVQMAFPGAGRTATSSGVEDFIDSVPYRKAHPDPNIIPFLNGVLDVSTMTLRAETKEDYILARLPHPYDFYKSCPLYTDFITKLMTPPTEYLDSEHYHNDHIRSIETLEEYFGYCLVQSHEFRNAVFLVGKTSTGKSELVKVLKELMPREWVSDVAMSLLDDPNAVTAMVNTHINISGEIGRHNRDVDTALLKITSGEPIPLKILYKDRYNGVVAARLFFHGNLPPDTTDSTGAVAKRMILLRTTDIPPENAIPEYHKLLIEEAPGILNRWVKAYARLRERGRFEPPHYSEIAVRQATEEANSVSAWMSQLTEQVQDVNEGTPSNDLFMSYREFCEAGKMYCYSVVQWGRLLTAIGVPSKPRRIAGNRVINYRCLKLLNETIKY